MRSYKDRMEDKTNWKLPTILVEKQMGVGESPVINAEAGGAYLRHGGPTWGNNGSRRRESKRSFRRTEN